MNFYMKLEKQICNSNDMYNEQLIEFRFLLAKPRKSSVTDDWLAVMLNTEYTGFWLLVISLNWFEAPFCLPAIFPSLSKVWGLCISESKPVFVNLSIISCGIVFPLIFSQFTYSSSFSNGIEFLTYHTAISRCS